MGSELYYPFEKLNDILPGKKNSVTRLIFAVIMVVYSFITFLMKIRLLILCLAFEIHLIDIIVEYKHCY